MDIEISETTRMVRDTVRRFVKSELIPIEPIVIRRDAERGYTDMPLIPEDIEKRLQEKASELGLWGVDVPQELGGQGLGMLTKCAVIEELKNSFVPQYHGASQFENRRPTPPSLLTVALMRGSRAPR